MRAVNVIEAKLRTLATFPERGRQTDRPGRRELPIPFGAYGYLARYRIAADEVVVTRIFHSREKR